MNPLVQAIVGSLVRAILLSLGTYLSQHGALTSDQAAHLTADDTIEKVIGWLMMAGAVAWSIWQKQGGLKHVQAALHLAPGSTMDEIKDRAAKPDIAAVDLKATVTP